MQPGTFCHDTFDNFLISSRVEDAESLLQLVSSAAAGWVKKKKTFNEESKYKRKDAIEPELSALAAASRVHGSMEVLQAVLLLLPPSLKDRQQARQGQAGTLMDRASEQLSWGLLSGV